MVASKPTYYRDLHTNSSIASWFHAITHIFQCPSRDPPLRAHPLAMSNNVDHDSDSEPALVRLETSERFCSADGDVTFQSSDGVLFKLHRKNLEVCTGGFAPPKIPTLDEIVQLTESASTLELLFQFLYPQRHPDLKDISFNVLEPLAEAAEKYQVYPAMTVCPDRMCDAIPSYPVEVLNYAFKHDYNDLADEAAHTALSMSLDRIATEMAPGMMPTWMQYYGKWLIALQSACAWGSNSHSTYQCQSRFPSGEKCSLWLNYRSTIMSLLGGKVSMILPQSLSVLDDIYSTQTGCISQCRSAWKAYINEQTSTIPKFSQLYAH